MIFICSPVRLLLTGAAAGFVCGLFGAGGGMVLIPLLIRFCHMDTRTSFASALSVMLPITIVSLSILYFTTGIPFRDALPYLFGGTIGGVLAGIFYKKIPTTLLRRVMGILILWGGIRLIWN